MWGEAISGRGVSTRGWGLMEQTYIGVLSSAWCPGGRTTAKPFCKQQEQTLVTQLQLTGHLAL